MRRWRTAGTTVAALVALGAVSFACGSPASMGAGTPPTSPSDSDRMVIDPDDGVTGAPAGNGPKGRAERREPEPGLRNPYSVSWERPKVRGRDVTLFYWSGVKDCYGLDHVDVKETADKVTITLYDGSRPDAEMCIEIAVEARTTVTLSRPLGDRKLVDGS